MYKLTHPPGGTWKETILHTFSQNPDDAYPYNKLAMDAVGNLFGATTEGGIYGFGIVFELSPQAMGPIAKRYRIVFREETAVRLTPA